MGDESKVWVNGERIAALEAGQETILETLKEHNNLLLEFIGPEGRCTKERLANETFRVEVAQRRETIYTHIRGLWIVVIAMVGGIWWAIQEALKR